MRLKEILVEKISTTSHIEELTDNITDISFNIMRKFNNDMTKKDILVKLSTSVSKYIQKFIDDTYSTNIIISFKKLEGDASGQYIPTENKFIFTSKLLHNLTIHLYDNGLFVNRYGKNSNEIRNHITSDIKLLVKIILHELTHVLQNLESGTSYEKSYIKDYDSVNKILSRPSIDLGTKKKRKEYVKKGGDPEDVNMNRLNALFNRIKNKDIYYAQPEEIEAYAQESAIEIIQQMDDMAPTAKIKYITVILSKIQHNVSTDAIPSVVGTYAAIGKKHDPRIYNRYLKKLYQELDSYRSKIKKW